MSTLEHLDEIATAPGGSGSSGEKTVNEGKEASFEQIDGIQWTARFIAAGFVAIVLVAIIKGGFFSVMGLSLMVAFACLFAGGFIGFLFGIPKVLQNANNNGQTDSTEKVVSNTNLEQISDWLTKIIVGISLTQMPALRVEFAIMAKNLAIGFQPSFGDTSFAYAYACALLLFYSICGFLLLYLWARTHLLMQLNLLGKLLSHEVTRAFKDIREDILKAMSVSFRITELKRKLGEFNSQKTALLQAESENPVVKQIIDIASPAPMTVLDDGQKNRWGGRAVDGAYSLTASFSKPPNSDNYEVTLKLGTSDATNAPITGPVYFLLHSTYAKPVVMVNAVNGSASHLIYSGEAFTVAVVFNQGRNKLELDLNQYADSPPEYRYIEILPTESSLTQELATLENQLKAIDFN